MSRKYIDCREYKQNSPKKCTVAISADSADELIETVVQHGIKVHGYADTPEYREHIRQKMKEGHPRA